MGMERQISGHRDDGPLRSGAIWPAIVQSVTRYLFTPWNREQTDSLAQVITKAGP